MNPILTTSERWNAPTSPFFKPIHRFGVWIAAVSAAVAGLTAWLSTAGIPVPGLVEQISVILGVIGAVMATLSKLTVDFDRVDWQGIYKARNEKQRGDMGYYRFTGLSRVATISLIVGLTACAELNGGLEQGKCYHFVYHYPNPFEEPATWDYKALQMKGGYRQMLIAGAGGKLSALPEDVLAKDSTPCSCEKLGFD